MSVQGCGAHPICKIYSMCILGFYEATVVMETVQGSFDRFGFFLILFEQPQMLVVVGAAHVTDTVCFAMAFQGVI